MSTQKIKELNDIIHRVGWIVADMLADGAVTNAKIANKAVTGAKIADKTIAGANVADNAIAAAQILNNSVQVAQMAGSSRQAAETKLGQGTDDNDSNGYRGGKLEGARARFCNYNVCVHLNDIRRCNPWHKRLESIQGVRYGNPAYRRPILCRRGRHGLCPNYRSRIQSIGVFYRNKIAVLPISERGWA